MMHLSKTNQEQYGLRTLKHKQLLFCLKCVYLPASKCTRTPIYTSLDHLCLTKRLLAYHLHLFPMKFPKNAMDQRSLYQTFVAKVKFRILSMKHLKDRRDCVWSTWPTPAIISPNDPKWKIWRAASEFMWNLLSQKKHVFLPWCQKCEHISHPKLPIYITKQSLMNQLQPLSNSYPFGNVAWTTKLFSSKKPRWYDFQIWTQLLSIAI